MQKVSEPHHLSKAVPTQLVKMDRPARVLVVAVGLIPTIVIGMLKPLAKLEEKGDIKLRLRYSAISLWRNQDLDWCDVAVFYRNQSREDLAILYELKRRGKRVIYGTDDNFMEIPLNTDIGRNHRVPSLLHGVRRFYQLADIVHVYSERIKQQVERFGGNPILFRSYFDTTLLEGLKKPQNSTKSIRIAYATARIDDPRLEQVFFGALHQIAVTYGERVEIHFWKTPPEKFRGLDNVKINAGVADYEQFVEQFFLAGFDIGLAPSIDEPFFHSKTNNKYREYGGCQIAGIYSNVPPYSDSVVHGETGWLAENTIDGWVEGISHLIESSEMRDRIVDGALKDVEENYSLSNSLTMWSDTISQSLSAETTKPTWLFEENVGKKVIIIGEQDENKIKNLEGDEEWHKEVPQYSYYSQACSQLGVEIFLNTFDWALSKREIAGYSSVVYLVKNDDEFETMLPALALGRSSIVDMTMFSGDLFGALRSLSRASTSLNISILVNEMSMEMDSQAFGFDRPGLIVMIPKSLSDFKESYSIEGRVGALMDIVERHFQYGVPQPTSVWQRLERKRSQAGAFVRVRWLHFSDRLYRIRVLLSWRIGRREI